MPYNKIIQISQSDLKVPFPNVLHFEIGTNVIEILEDSSFDNHSNLQVVWFGSNKISHVGKNVFNNINKITWLSFQSNLCINMDARGDSSENKMLRCEFRQFFPFI